MYPWGSFQISSVPRRKGSCLPQQDILWLEVDGMDQAVAYWQFYTIVRALDLDGVCACENTIRCPDDRPWQVSSSWRTRGWGQEEDSDPRNSRSSETFASLAWDGESLQNEGLKLLQTTAQALKNSLFISFLFASRHIYKLSGDTAPHRLDHANRYALCTTFTHICLCLWRSRSMTRTRPTLPFALAVLLLFTIAISVRVLQKDACQNHSFSVYLWENKPWWQKAKKKKEKKRRWIFAGGSFAPWNHMYAVYATGRLQGNQSKYIGEKKLMQYNGDATCKIKDSL